MADMTALVSPVKRNLLKTPDLKKTMSPGAVPYRHVSTENSSYLTPRRKETALEIKRREEIRAQRNRMRDILVQNMTNKFGPRWKKRVVKHVELLLSRKRDLTPQDLHELEEAILADRPSTSEQESKSNNPTPRLQQPPPLSIQDWGSNNNNNNSSSQRSNRSHSASSRRPSSRGGPLTPLPLGSEWEALDMFQALEAADKTAQAKKKIIETKKELAATLAQQVKEAEERRKQEKEKELEYIAQMNGELERYKHEQEVLEKKKQEKNDYERMLWEKQIEADREAKRQEAARILKEEQDELARIAENIAQEKKRIQDRKDMEARIHQKIVEENEENDRRKARERLAEQEENNRLAQEYSDRLEAEDKARQDAFQKRVEKLELVAKWSNEGPVGKGRREEEQRFEELLLKEQLLKEERDKKREEDDAAAKLERARLMNKQNAEQLELRRRLKMEEKERDQEYMEREKKAAEEYQAELQEARRRVKMAQQEYGNLLLEQINVEQQTTSAMTPVEQSINKRAMETISEDPVFHSRVMHRIRMHTASKSKREPRDRKSVV